MSLHIESTEDALAELKKQRTKTLTAAISVSFLGVALMGLLLYLVHIIVAVPEDPPMVAYATQEGDNPDIDTPEVTQTTQRPSSSSTSAQVKVIAAVATADVAVVNPDIEVDVPSEELSIGIDIGDGFGTGTGDGDGGGIPGIISKRCDLNDRMKRITENGGTPQCEEAVVKSLRWLKKQQNQDGSWGGAPHNYKCAMTGMALLSYLAHCETPLSEEFGETVLKGISFLVDQGMKNPVLSLVPQRNEVSYDHAVATYALCEAYTFCKQMDIPSISNLEKVVVKAVDKIVDNQNTDGGWAYNYNTKAGAHTDLSVTGWNVQALKAAEHGGIRPSKGEIRTALRKAAAYCRKCGKPDGLFTYMQEGREDATARPALVGVGVLSLQMCGNGSDSAARKGLDWMLKNTNQPFNWKANNTSSNLYQHYYGVQAAMNRGGDVWKAYNKAFRDATLGAQATDGSFTPNGFPGPGGLVNSNGSSINDKIYRQCLATLMLEVYYRFLPGTGEGTRNS
ncbi:prenyltransferase/squalene oxidase repeat-containing protein [uncultured Akkermansia sp.]|uniref:prenyltransferase/squalene oxidase repeat-containing protein n=1 Tax=uncultured Akkermansia sp. TaxID=512294 RepID=UPI002636B4BC|nr:prenyltransferase/squalene oxidase repeat-containing protein [uncultured Akkermansia sp.]